MKAYNIIALGLAFFLAIYKNFLKLIPVPFCSIKRGFQFAVVSKIPLTTYLNFYFNKISMFFSFIFNSLFNIIYFLYDFLFVNTLLNSLGFLCGCCHILAQKTNIHIIKQTHTILLTLWDSSCLKFNRKRLIKSSLDEDYLIRYYVLFKNRLDFIPFNIFIHNFKSSDPDDLHDHPWGFFTFILSGGYWEHFEKDGKLVKEWRYPGYYQMVDSKYKHRVELEKDISCWTLFIPFKREREWGFYTKNDWIKNTEYNEYIKNK